MGGTGAGARTDRGGAGTFDPVRNRALLVIVLAALVLGAACSKKSAKRDHGAITKAGLISVFDLRPGDCLMPDDKVKGEVEKINAVPCTDPHTQEVFAVP